MGDGGQKGEDAEEGEERRRTRASLAQHQHQPALGLETHTRTHTHAQPYIQYAACQRVRHRLIVLPASRSQEIFTVDPSKQGRAAAASPSDDQLVHRQQTPAAQSKSPHGCKWRVSTPTQREARSSSQHATKASASVCRPDGLRCIGPALAWSPMQQSMFMFAQAAHHWLASGGEATDCWANR